MVVFENNLFLLGFSVLFTVLFKHMTCGWYFLRFTFDLLFLIGDHWRLIFDSWSLKIYLWHHFYFDQSEFNNLISLENINAFKACQRTMRMNSSIKVSESLSFFRMITVQWQAKLWFAAIPFLLWVTTCKFVQSKVLKWKHIDEQILLHHSTLSLTVSVKYLML